MSDDKIKIYQPRLEAGYPDPFTGDMVTVCFNKEWVPLLQGFLAPLRWKRAIWMGTEEEVDQITEYVHNLLDALSGDGEICVPDCEPIADLRVLNGKLQKKLCGSDTWVTVGRLNPIVSYTRNMLQLDLDGDDIIDVSFGQNPTDNPTIREEQNENDHICAGVNGLLDWMSALLGDSIQATENFINNVSSAADTVLAIITLGGGEVTPVDNLIAFTRQASLALNNMKKFELEDTLIQEEIRCKLYCRLKVNAGDFTKAIYDDWLADFPPYPDPFGYTNLGDDFEQLIQWEAIQRRYNIYALNSDASCEGICVDCSDTWTVEFDFTIEDFSAFFADYMPFSQTSSVWQSGSGWESQTVLIEDGDNDQNALLNYLACDPSATFNIKSIEVSYVINGWSGNENQFSEPLAVRQEVEGALETVGGSASAFTNGNGLFIWTWDGDTDVNKLVWSFYGGFKYHPAIPNGEFTYQKIIISGGGVNPFE